MPRCLELPALAAHGNTTATALANIVNAVDESLKWLAEER